jgi:hypothetical protein
MIAERLALAGPAGDDRLGFAVSIVGHVLVLGLMAGLMPQFGLKTPPPEEIVPVEIVSLADVAQVTETPRPSIEAAPRETVLEAPERDEPAEQATPQPAESDAPPLPDAKPTPERRLNTRQLATVIDREIADAPRRPREFSDLAKQLERDLPRSAVLSPAEAATLAQLMVSQILRCANFPTGLEGLDRMRVVLRISLTPDGRVVGQPEVAEQDGLTSANAGQFRVFVEATKRAILRCQPYVLPADKYAAWKDQEINVNPRDLTR